MEVTLMLISFESQVLSIWNFVKYNGKLETDRTVFDIYDF